MNHLLEILLALSLVFNFVLLGSTRIGACVIWMAMQGALYSLVPLIAGEEITPRILVLATAALAMKGGIFPWLLIRLRRRTSFHFEVEPYIGFIASLLVGVCLLAAAATLGQRIHLTAGGYNEGLLTTAFFTILTGLLLITTRRKAVMQVVGYLVLENGIYLFGVGTVVEAPMLVELGVLLDAFVAVFVMSIAVYNLSRKFEVTDVDKLAELKG
ncbi:MAG: hydrogenase [Nitrospirae bacterium CG18_big_fil_WC_8_21_14_2_50_70_55]|nr:hydrogenase [Deltaproteobacteria bacterium]OIP66436.1 MAG: hypothetical protein AUK30_02450 [Nitrospirae bacterium CG2_30_70_394]PIQ05697.1 MAG: hydrogenase [Nitrospirae bacterium CG18_big_fil_WC_8_21_14_2_50_70_55]PIU79510.1 MAG: hydrogenase [Nitrospirae bacterium CG06_land_8_20_14_3_00_70_43]PIW83818.1 MAG: hydrogenase [Nitrospirae bacterium CG_4_8_14_3_um_filter_70_85]PIX82201.1 MAG: hydrogenase [Nitrospirae bacterium CG_4_10_14_3_um_filter_70_108]PJB96579.1 MAG: hydrogenase [Nitrospira